MKLEYVMLFLLIVIVVLLIILLSRRKESNESNITSQIHSSTMDLQERIGRNSLDNASYLEKHMQHLNQNLMDFEVKLENALDQEINAMNQKVDNRLYQGFKETNETFKEIVERISKIDEAQKHIQELSTDIISLNDILSDKKSRGTFGEVTLKQIMTSVFGEKSDRVYQMQYHFQNGLIADAVLFAPKPLGLIAIDSKFPLENFRQMVDQTLDKQEREQAKKRFKTDMKTHIEAISTKYIILGETSENVILFLPSEAVFSEINSYHEDILSYAYQKHVWITSPSTLMAFLTTLLMMLQNIERDKYASLIHKELQTLSQEFERYHLRWDKLKHDFDNVMKDVNDIHISTNKLTNRFEEIALVENLPKKE